MTNVGGEPAGDDCGEAKVMVPLVNRNRCEAKGPCVEVCPYGVFELGKLDQDLRRTLSFGGRVKAFFHGYRQVFVAAPDRCHACGLCVSACPEKALTLVAAAARTTTTADPAVQP